MRFNESFEIWCDGIIDEMAYWEDYLRTDGGNFKHNFEEYVERNKKFQFEYLLPDDPSRLVRFIDVGSGPFSTCGHITGKVSLSFEAMDPLGNFYNKIKKKYVYDNGIEIKQGFVELLDKYYEQNTFDMVHMRNSLDHCFNPVYALSQLIYICKVGGKIILMHYENEAENEKYLGMHQWNLTVKDNIFVIWNREKKYDVAEVFKDYVNIEIEQNQNGRNNEHFVLIEKVKEITLPIPSLENEDYYDDMLNVIFEKLIDANSILNNSSNRIIEMEESRLENDRKKERYKRKLRFVIHDECLESLIIYGMGNNGRILIDECKQCGIKIDAVLDREYKEYSGLASEKPIDFINRYKGETIVISINEGCEDVMRNLTSIGYTSERMIVINTR